MASDRIQRRVERLLDQIEQEADQRNWQLVLELAQEVLRFAPDNADARTFIDVAEDTLSYTAGQEGPTRATEESPKISSPFQLFKKSKSRSFGGEVPRLLANMTAD